jgi:S-adenosyl methyltransferase
VNNPTYNDQVMLAHARALVTGPPRTVGYIDADLNDPGTLLAAARTQLGLTRPAAVLLMTTLGHI